MADIIKMNKEMMLEMKRRFLRGAEDLQNSMNQVNRIAGEIEQEGLQGDAGRAFVEALRGILNAKLNELNEKFFEMANDLQYNVDRFTAEDENARKEMGM